MKPEKRDSSGEAKRGLVGEKSSSRRVGPSESRVPRLPPLRRTRAKSVRYRRSTFIRFVRLDLMLAITWIPYLRLMSTVVALQGTHFYLYAIGIEMVSSLSTINAIFAVTPWFVGLLFLAYFTKVLVSHR